MIKEIFTPELKKESVRGSTRIHTHGKTWECRRSHPPVAHSMSKHLREWNWKCWVRLTAGAACVKRSFSVKHYRSHGTFMRTQRCTQNHVHQEGSFSSVIAILELVFLVGWGRWGQWEKASVHRRAFSSIYGFWPLDRRSSLTPSDDIA